VLTNGEISWLRDIQVNADGTLEGLEAIVGFDTAADFRNAWSPGTKLSSPSLTTAWV
jgi:hypothetical protein